MKLGTSFVFYMAILINPLQQRTLKWVYAKNSKVMERRDWWKNFRQNDGKRLLWTIFETFARTMHDCSEVWYIGRLKTSCTAATNLVLNQEGAPQTYLTSRQIARKTGIHRSSVVRVIWDDLRETTTQVVKKRRAQELSEANCINRLI